MAVPSIQYLGSQLYGESKIPRRVWHIKAYEFAISFLLQEVVLNLQMNEETAHVAFRDC